MSLKSIYLGEEAWLALRSTLESNTFSKVGIMVDSNTLNACYPFFMESLGLELPNLEIIEIEPGEGSKGIEVLVNLWHSLGELNFDRQSLIINLGGGVVSDLGGFMAATYMRGISFINFPTSLLAIADAAVGSKTGINFGPYKNRIGSFSDPIFVGIVPEFLESLEEQELRSGWAEMLKHGLIADEKHLQDLMEFPIQSRLPGIDLLARTIAIKAKVVDADKYEDGLRKILNFGHSVGHALESYFATTDAVISHGYAIALGMQVELMLSYRKLNFPMVSLEPLSKYLKKLYPWPETPIDQNAFNEILRGDKKNFNAELRLVLLKAIGKPTIDQAVSKEELWDALTEIANG